MSRLKPQVIKRNGYEGSLHYKHQLIEPTECSDTLDFWIKRCRSTDTPFTIVQYPNDLIGIITLGGTLNGSTLTV